jgi:uncharacterized protein (TIGR00266 family)
MSESLDFEIAGRPDFAILKVRLKQDQQVFAEPTAMASMDPTIELKAGFKGGLMKSLGRAFGGESLIVNTFTARRGGGEVVFAPGSMGDLVHYRLQGQGLMLQRGGYVANGPGVDVSGKWQGFRGFFSGEGLVLLRATGEGDLFFSTYGSIVEIDVRDAYYVDTGYIVAFEESLQYRVTTLPGLGVGSRIKSFLFGGEGLVCRFTGAGKLWVQTRAVNPFLTWVHPFRPGKSD